MNSQQVAILIRITALYRDLARVGDDCEQGLMLLGSIQDAEAIAIASGLNQLQITSHVEGVLSREMMSGNGEAAAA
jgi:hypothetical protein